MKGSITIVYSNTIQWEYNANHVYNLHFSYNNVKQGKVTGETNI